MWIFFVSRFIVRIRTSVDTHVYTCVYVYTTTRTSLSDPKSKKKKRKKKRQRTFDETRGFSLSSPSFSPPLPNYSRSSTHSRNFSFSTRLFISLFNRMFFSIAFQSSLSNVFFLFPTLPFFILSSASLTIAVIHVS